MLQFRAEVVEDIKSPECEVDCWILPRTGSPTTLRYALYRLLVQGFRRCQSMYPTQTPLYGHQPSYREFFSGRPVFNIGGESVFNPWGLVRKVDAAYGAFYWANEAGPVRGHDGTFIYDTQSLWQPPAAQAPGPTEAEGMDEDISDA